MTYKCTQSAKKVIKGICIFVIFFLFIIVFNMIITKAMIYVGCYTGFFSENSKGCYIANL